MRSTPILHAAPGFWRSFMRRTVDEFKRQTFVAIHLEGLTKPTRPYPMAQFKGTESIDDCKVMSDKDIGGFSRASLTFEPGNIPPLDMRTKDPPHEQHPGQEPPHALFTGEISTELPPKRPDIQRSGYAGWRTRDRGYSLFGKALFDIDPWTYLALRVKSDGRKYFVNIQTESIVPTDLHQHLLPATTPGQWEVVTIPLSAFVRTNFGMPVEPQKEMLSQKVRSVGIALTDRVQGSFELRIAEIYATNTPPGGKLEKESGSLLEDGQDHDNFSQVSRRKKEEPERSVI